MSSAVETSAVQEDSSGLTSSAAILRTIEPTAEFERYTIRSGTIYEGTSVLMGGTFYYDPGMTADDNTGIVIRTTTGDKAWVREFRSGHLHLNMFWEPTDTSYSQALARFDAAQFTSGYSARTQNLDFPSGSVLLEEPFQITANAQPHFWGGGGEDRGTIVYANWDVDSTDYDDYGLLHQVNTAVGNAGFSMHNIQINGNGRRGHGVYRYLAGHFVEEGCSIADFNGSGFQHIGCQDMWSDTSVQACGRTSGVRTALADVSNQALTTAAPIEISSGGGNAPNHCRYHCKQIESNYVSPYVLISANGGYGNLFRDVHTEQRVNIADFDSDNYTWATAIVQNGGEWVFDHMSIQQLTPSLTLGQYSATTLTNCQRFTSITSTGSNTSGTLVVDSCFLASFIASSRGGRLSITNTYFGGDVTLSYPTWDLGFNFSGNYVGGNFSLELDGSLPALAKFITNNRFMGDCTASVSAAHCINNYVAGDFTLSSSLGVDIGNKVIGARTVNSQASWRNDGGRRILFQPVAPTGGTFAVGDEVVNSAPTVGQASGWRCSTAGSPGTWLPTSYFLGTNQTSGPELSGYAAGAFTPSQVIFSRLVNATFATITNFNGGAGYVDSMTLDVAPTSSWTLLIYRGAVSIGSVTFASGSLVPTACSVVATTFVAGSKFRIVAPVVADASAAGLSWTIATTRT